MLADEITAQIDAGRKTIQRSLDDVQKQVPAAPVRPVVMAAGFAVVVVAVGAAWFIYRSRRRKTLVRKLQDALPDSVRDLPDELRSKARRPLERALKAL